MTPETLAKFTEKITELHHDLLGLLNGFDVVWMELGDLENMADKNLGTHLTEYADQVGAGMTDEEWKAYNAKFEPTKEQEESK